MSVVQIAERAGVSIATVSRVLNNSRRVQPQIIEQVRKAMQELNLPARRPRRRSSDARRTGAIAILSLGQSYRGWFEMPVIGAVVAEITRVAEDHDLGVRMTEMHDPTQLSAVVQQQQVDGAIVFVPSTLDARATALLQQHIPIVRVMGAQIAPLSIDHVGPDNLSIGHLAGEYLLEHGCRELAFVSTQPKWTISKLRSEGFAVAARQAGVTPTAYLVTDDPGEAAAFCTSTCARPTLAELVDELVARRPAGVFVSRDEEVVQVYRLLAERGVTPGTDVTIVSCDNENVRLSMLHPRPASIEIGTAEIARYAVRRLIQRIKHPADPPVRILVNPTLIVPLNGDGNRAPRITVA